MSVGAFAMGQLAGGLYHARHFADALPVQEAELSTLQRLGAPEYDFLTSQGNLANTYHMIGRREDALRLRRDVYSGCCRLDGAEAKETIIELANYASLLCDLERHAEIKSLLRKNIPVARRVLGENENLVLRMRTSYAAALCSDRGASLDDLREALTILEETARTARRVFGGAHPSTRNIEGGLRQARARFALRELLGQAVPGELAGDQDP